MSDLRRIDVLLNEKSGERFNIDDVIKLKTVGTYGREVIGRIHWIETLNLTIDVSLEYKSKTEKIEFDDILRIEKYNIK